MGFVVSESLERQFALNMDVEKVYQFLANVPEIFIHYPGVKKITQLDQGVFQWQMHPISIFSNALKIKFASEYICDEKTFTIKWSSADSIGNAQVIGHWKFNPIGKSRTYVHFYVRGEFFLPYSRLLKPITKVILKKEGIKLTDIYLGRLIKAMQKIHDDQNALIEATP